jgi:hypothetical protein
MNKKLNNVKLSSINSTVGCMLVNDVPQRQIPLSGKINIDGNEMNFEYLGGSKISRYIRKHFLPQFANSRFYLIKGHNELFWVESMQTIGIDENINLFPLDNIANFDYNRYYRGEDEEQA